MTMTQRRGVVILGAALACALAAAVGAREITFKGTIQAVEKARVQVLTVDDKGKAAEKADWFAVTDKTKVLRGDKAVPVAEALLTVGEPITIVVAAGDEAGIEWTCSMHPEVAEPKPGRCPKCGMTLKERARPAKASEIRLPAK